jgi:hypothetical protein
MEPDFLAEVDHRVQLSLHAVLALQVFPKGILDLLRREHESTLSEFVTHSMQKAFSRRYDG